MDLQYIKYRIPFTQRFQTGQRSYKCREGIILQLRKEGLIAYGEAAPLTGFSPERLKQVTAQLHEVTPQITHLFKRELDPGDLDDFYDDHSVVPSLRFALDTLVCDYKAQIQDLPVSRLLFDSPAASFPVNDLITIQSRDSILTQVKHSVDTGYSTLKFKIGNDITEQLDILQEIRNQFPEIIIRLDANRSWGMDEASKNLARLESLDVEYCEEPLAEPTPENLKRLTEITPVPIALDETLSNWDILQTVASFIPVLVIKPTVIGQISKLFATKRLADTHESKVIFTTALESGVGRLMIANLTSGLGSHKAAHGLGTGKFLTMDVWHDGTYINNGYFSLPVNSGQDQKYRSNLQKLAEKIYFPCE